MSTYVANMVENDADKASLMQFWERETNWSQKRFEWFYGENGYGLAGTGTLSVKGDDAVIGCSSYFVRQFYVGDEQVVGGINCDILVDQKHRTLGPALMLIKNLINVYSQRGLGFLLAFPNHKSRPVFMRCGYKEIGKSYRWSKPLNFEAKLKGRFRSKVLVKILTLILNPAAKIISAEFVHKYFSLRNKCKLKSINLSDMLDKPDISKVAGINCYGGRLGGYVAWRYDDAADSISYKILSIRKRGDEIGYLVYSLNKGVALIHDIAPLSIKDFDSVLASFSSYARKLNAESISIGFFGAQQYKTIMKKHYFVQREGRSVMLYCEDERLSEILAQESGWYLMDGDVDL